MLITLAAVLTPLLVLVLFVFHEELARGFGRARACLPSRDPVLRFMRLAKRKLCYTDIRDMELDLYGRSFDHQNSRKYCDLDDWERARYRCNQEQNRSREWRQEFEIPLSQQNKEKG